LATDGLPGCERVLDGCELVAAIVDKFSSGLAVAVTVALSCAVCLEEACKCRLALCCFFLCTTFLLLYLGSFEQQVPHFLLACRVSCFLHLTHMTFFAKAGRPAFLFVVGAVACAAGLLFWPVEAIMVGFFTVREFHQLWPTARSSGSRPTGWLPPSPNSTI